MDKYYFQISIGIVTIFLLVILASIFLRQPTTTGEDPSFTINTPLHLPDQVLAIDMDAHDGRPINEGDIAKGSSPLLVLIRQDDNGIRREPQFIKDFDELALLDTNKNGQIDPSDQNYKNLYLAYMQPKGFFRYVPLASAGIYALFLNQRHSKGMQNSLSNEFLQSADTAVLIDSSRRAITPVLIGQQVLSKINAAHHQLHQ